MTSDRPYRKALSIEEALDEIVRNRSTQFDPEMVDALLGVHQHGRLKTSSPANPISHEE
jgi:HD-GYP domain-containing protein (c-di-GMP phosphodiesterase class II)